MNHGTYRRLRCSALLIVALASNSSTFASSYPPGDNNPLLIPYTSTSTRVYFSCLDYQSDDGVMQCGRLTSSDDPGDCYYVELDAKGKPDNVRHMRVCKDITYMDALSTEEIEAIYAKNADRIDFATTAAGKDSILALHTEGGIPKLWLYTSTNTKQIPVDWSGWVVKPAVGASAASDGDLLAVVGRICKGTWPTHEADSPIEPYLDCDDAPGPRLGDFGILLIDLDRKTTTTRILGNPAGVMFGDIVSTPVLIDDQVFLGWAKNTGANIVLTISSYESTTDRYCEWSIDQNGAINPPVPIDLKLTGDRLLAAASRDGLITVLSIDLEKWNTSCGNSGVDVHRITPIRTSPLTQNP